MSEGSDARRFLRRRRHGVLSTLSRRFDGYPHGSAVPFVPDHVARPVILVSRLAEHTRNLEGDSRVSLLVQDGDADVQAGARLTLVGDARPGKDMELARYLNYSPGAERLLALGDFSFWTIEPRALRFIGGFGDIRWISAADYAPPRHALAGDEDAIVSHMNLEHAHNLLDYCRHYHGRDTAAATMVGIDCDGFDVRAGEVVLRFDFEPPVLDAAGARAALVAMARKAAKKARPG
jgi:putative heme iron utilization protein